MADTLQKRESAIRTRVECEEKAFHIVNRLIEDKVDGSFLIKCGQFISREHYKDVVEERAISYLCGYPLCNKTLKDIPKKQFHISTSTNKVYDISERKNFCSNQCLKASKHYSNQIPESPLWSRAKERAVEFKLLPHTGISGMVGSEVIGISPKRLLEFEIKKLEELDLQTTPSNKTSIKNHMISPVVRATGTNTTIRDENNFKSMQTSFESLKEGSHVGEDNEVGIDTTRVSFNAPENRKTLKLEQTLQKEINLKENNESNPSGINMIHKGKETTVYQQKNNLTKKQAVNNVEDCNHISTIVDEERICDAVLINKVSDLTLNDTMHKESVNIEKHSTEMDYLMKLLSKHKTVLSGMVDVVTAVDYHSDTTQITSPEAVNGKSDILLYKNNEDKCTFSQDFSKQSTPESNLIPQSSNKSFSQVSLVEPSSEQTSFQDNIIHSSAHKGSSQNNLIQPSPNQSFLETSAAEMSSINRKKSSGKPKPVTRSPLKHIGTVLKTWITEDTIAYIHSSSSGRGDESPMTFADPRVQRGYADLCRRLDSQQKDFQDLLDEAVGSDLSVNDSNRALKSVPDYNILKTEAEAYQLKVAEFMTGKSLQSKQKKKDDDVDDRKDEAFIPTVDAHDQRQIRIKIVLDRLDKFLPDLLGPLHLSLQAVSSYIRELVYTFRLDKDNIVFRPSEWILVVIFVLKMLGKKNRNISAAFTDESAIRHFSILLKGIGHTVTDLDVVMENILRS